MSMHLRGGRDMIAQEEEGWWKSRTGLEQKLLILSTLLFIVTFGLTISVIVLKHKSNSDSNVTTLSPSPTEEPSPTSPTEETSPTSPTEETSPTSPTEETSPTSPTEETSPTSPTEETSPTSPTAESSPTSPTEEPTTLSTTSLSPPSE